MNILLVQTTVGCPAATLERDKRCRHRNTASCIFYTAAVFGLTMTGSVFAADLQSTKSPPVFEQSPVFTWSGLYVGVQLGVGVGTDSAALPGYTTTYNPDGIVGGAHIGYNYQMNQAVLGVEADVDGSSISQSFFDTPTAITFDTKLPVEGSVRGRIGWVAWNNTLFYATAGGAFASVETTYTGAFGSYSYSRALAGWTVGAGADVPIDRNWSFRAEYRYADLGHQSDLVGGVLPINHHITENSARVGLNYKFDSIAQIIP
jgi:outer membrane immunogenic protein